MENVNLSVSEFAKFHLEKYGFELQPYQLKLFTLMQNKNAISLVPFRNGKSLARKLLLEFINWKRQDND